MKKKSFVSFFKLFRKAISCTILAVSLAVSNLAGLYPGMKVHASGSGKILQIGSAALSDNPGAVGAPTVFYGNDSSRRWRVINYNGTGALSTDGVDNLTLLAGGYFGEGRFVQFINYGNDYSGSVLKAAIDAIYSTTYFSSEEMSSIVRRELLVDEYRINPYSDGISGSALTGNNAPFLWPLSSREAIYISQNVARSSDNYMTLGRGTEWWLRSPGSYDDTCLCVDESGVACSFYGDVLQRQNTYELKTRPAFNIGLSNIVLTSAAVGGKSSGTVGAGALASVADYSGNDWKLTIADPARNGFSAECTDPSTLAPGETAQISYSGALTGTNEYVSAIITDVYDRVLYYGNIASCTAATGTANIDIPADAPTVFKLYVLQEKCNGNYMTDYSSALINLTPWVSAGSASSSTPQGSLEEYFADLENAFDYAIALGGTQTVTWSTDCALTYGVMELLAENPSITLVFSYTYEDMDYTVTIPGRIAKFDPEIPVYGPLYLYGTYGGTVKKHQ